MDYTNGMDTKKKLKEKKPIDYSRVSDEIWNKTWAEFLDSMNQIEVSLLNLERKLNAYRSLD